MLDNRIMMCPVERGHRSLELGTVIVIVAHNLTHVSGSELTDLTMKFVDPGIQLHRSSIQPLEVD